MRFHRDVDPPFLPYDLLSRRERQAYIPVMGPLVLNAISSVEEKSIAIVLICISTLVSITSFERKIGTDTIIW